eukprot:scaffold27744_cov29-Phaeocystis_antarctica.AAC.1
MRAAALRLSSCPWRSSSACPFACAASSVGVSLLVRVLVGGCCARRTLASLASCLPPLERAIFPLYAAASLLAALATQAASIGISGRSSSSSHAGAPPSLSPLNGLKRKRLTLTLLPSS